MCTFLIHACNICVWKSDRTKN